MQNVSWSDVGAERAGWNFANSADVVNTARGTRLDFTVFVKHDVWRQVAGEIDAVAIGQVMLQSALIRGGINLSQVVDASVGWASSAFGSMQQGNHHQIKKSNKKSTNNKKGEKSLPE